MKRLLTLFAAIIFTLNLFAQAPQKMSYQAVIRNASNALVSNAPVKMRISILQGSATGNAVYSELHSATTNVNGLVSIEIGAGTSPQGTFSSINWGNGTYFLKTETDPTNGTNYSIVGTSQLLSVPYALESKNAAKAISAETALKSDSSKFANNATSAGDGIKGVSNDTLTLNNGDKYIIPGIKKIGNSPSTLNNGLVGFWPFNGNANDESGNGNNLTVVGPTLTFDRFGSSNKAYLFQGVQNNAQYLITNQITNLKISNYSYSVWFKVNSFYPNTTQNGPFDYANFNALSILSINSNNWDIGPAINSLINSNAKQLNCGQWTQTSGGQICVPNNIISSDQWYNLIVSYNGNKIMIYINGLLACEKNALLSYNNQFDLTIGGIRNGTAMSVMGGFKGIIDDLRWYDRVLTQEEITYLANN